MASYFDQLEAQLFERAAAGDTIIVQVLVKARVRKTGKPIETPMLQVVKVDREKEVITEIRPCCWDVGGLNKALGV